MSAGRKGPCVLEENQVFLFLLGVKRTLVICKRYRALFFVFAAAAAVPSVACPLPGIFVVDACGIVKVAFVVALREGGKKM